MADVNNIDYHVTTEHEAETPIPLIVSQVVLGNTSAENKSQNRLNQGLN